MHLRAVVALMAIAMIATAVSAQSPSMGIAARLGGAGGTRQDVPEAAAVTKPTRVAFLDFGKSLGDGRLFGHTLGVHVTAQAWREAIPLLESDGVDVVVVRVRSGGGSYDQSMRFHALFQHEYETRFRTVAWIDTALHGADHAVMCIDEMYMKPVSSLGRGLGCWPCCIALSNPPLEVWLADMEQAARDGGRSHFLARSMIVIEPLSADVGSDGTVVLRQDELGEIPISSNLPLCLDSELAVRIGVVRGVVATEAELLEMMGIERWERAGVRAAEHIDAFNVLARSLENSLYEYKRELDEAMAAAKRSEGAVRRAWCRCGEYYLAEVMRIASIHQGLAESDCIDESWGEAQRAALAEIAAGPPKEAEPPARVRDRL